MTNLTEEIEKLAERQTKVYDESFGAGIHCGAKAMLELLEPTLKEVNNSLLDAADSIIIGDCTCDVDHVCAMHKMETEIDFAIQKLDKVLEGK